ncbi:MAG: hypothetical protein H0W62_12315 [Chitinophagales bacterium]|nr:hypothetical protein [Chitinophagales bacterium]
MQNHLYTSSYDRVISKRFIQLQQVKVQKYISPGKLWGVFIDINERYDKQHRRVPRIPAKAIWWRHGLGLKKD